MGNTNSKNKREEDSKEGLLQSTSKDMAMENTNSKCQPEEEPNDWPCQHEIKIQHAEEQVKILTMYESHLKREVQRLERNIKDLETFFIEFGYKYPDNYLTPMVTDLRVKERRDHRDQETKLIKCLNDMDTERRKLVRAGADAKKENCRCVEN